MNEELKETKATKIRNWFNKHKTKIAGGAGFIAGTAVMFFFKKVAAADNYAMGVNAAMGEDDSVIITDEYEIDYGGKKYNGFSILDSDSEH